MDETVNIPINIMKDLKTSNEFSKKYHIENWVITNKNITNFIIQLPSKKNIRRRFKHIQKLRAHLLLIWPGFIPIPQISLEVLGKANISNELQSFILNNFIKEIVQYDFLRESKEFKIAFDENVPEQSFEEL